MSTIPRVPPAVPGAAADLGALLAHQPALAAAFGRLYVAFWNSGVLDHRTKEVARIRNARITDCGF